MIRMQIQIDAPTREALRRRAFEEGKSQAAVAREILESALLAGKPAPSDRPRTAYDLFPFIGIGKADPADGVSNIAENHDDYTFEEDEP